MLDKILDKYDKRFMPDAEVMGETRVKIHSVEEMSTSDGMKFAVQLTYRQKYNDSRLSFGNESGLRLIYLEDTQAIWTPKIYIWRSFDRKIHDQYGRIYPNGEVLFIERISFAFVCPMDLVNYPFDTQFCPIEFLSSKKF